MIWANEDSRNLRGDVVMTPSQANWVKQCGSCLLEWLTSE